MERVTKQSFPHHKKDGAESDSALITDSLSAESVVSVTESLLEHPSGE